MRKLFALLLCMLCLAPGASAAEQPKYAALTFDEGPSGQFTRQLLAELEKRDVNATFFLWGCRLAEHPELAGEMMDAGHEIGIHGYSRESLQNMSRRDIARELSDTRALLPEGCKVRFFRPLEGGSSDGVRQVSEVTRLAILNWSAEPRNGRDPIRDGDVIRLRDADLRSLDTALSVIDRLQAEGFRLVTVSELARIRDVKIKSGRLYDKFPAKVEEEESK